VGVDFYHSSQRLCCGFGLLVELAIILSSKSQIAIFSIAV
jgi:hypothetical protein